MCGPSEPVAAGYVTNLDGSPAYAGAANEQRQADMVKAFMAGNYDPTWAPPPGYERGPNGEPRKIGDGGTGDVKKDDKKVGDGPVNPVTPNTKTPDYGGKDAQRVPPDSPADAGVYEGGGAATPPPVVKKAPPAGGGPNPDVGGPTGIVPGSVADTVSSVSAPQGPDAEPYGRGTIWDYEGPHPPGYVRPAPATPVAAAVASTALPGAAPAAEQASVRPVTPGLYRPTIAPGVRYVS